MKHALDTNIAKQFGVNIALLLESFQFWTFKNLARKKHIYDGLCWSYDTLESLGDTFSYWTRRQIEHTINNAVKHGLLVKGNYNQTKYDRTIWYALTPKAYAFFPDLLDEKYMELLYSSISQNCEIDYTNFRNGFPKIVTPIPVTNPVTKPDIKNISTSCEVPVCDDIVLDEKSDNNLNYTSRVESEGQLLESKIESTKSDNCENKTKIRSNERKSEQFGLKEILNDNPFQLPEQKIKDWITNRKKKRAPVHRTAWERVKKDLGKCQNSGIDPLEAFDKAVSASWLSIEVEYFIPKNDLAKHEALKKRSLELEQIAERRKQREIEDSKKFKGIVSEASKKERSKLRKMMGLPTFGELSANA